MGQENPRRGFKGPPGDFGFKGKSGFKGVPGLEGEKGSSILPFNRTKFKVKLEYNSAFLLFIH
jgi:hypothetical protein